MVVHGKVGQFNEDIEDWTAYCERVVQYFTANDIEADEKRRAVLLSVCGAHIYQLVRSLVSPGKPTDKSLVCACILLVTFVASNMLSEVEHCSTLKRLLQTNCSYHKIKSV